VELLAADQGTQIAAGRAVDRERRTVMMMMTIN
jgi:hypothetical protein